ncbi:MULTISPECIES: TnsA-like heteromeric transposase endonuclease subunit [unclassified Streptomyces]|uniref:TnsA-like heteromeric transposase endonuclease subunit n=1 Tax=unclassified Streptomyces TaxID=2593676 RepID=UPI00081E9F89|nr:MULTISPECIES: TnsA-like heteromeric transposase endonuclease subunit [unclassified Streptomyces]MYZ35018.1 TnsA-like heteromeric transposase endonuclease subunit [Streptomyces sp. SID4917]SCF72127.1 TnsA endonuclease N terminal [Streptomyces sp. MnatMP-M17]
MEATVSFRGHSGGVEECSWASVAPASLHTAHPWRTFRWYRDQKHYSGTYWSATMRNHVIYESRLELSRLLFADFDPSVRGIVAQPFLLQTVLEGKVRRHIPDYLLLTGQVPVVVDVKPWHRLSRSEVAFTFDWTRQVVESRGWKYEVWSEPPAAELENIRFLAGYRRDWLFSPEILGELRDADLNGVLLGQAVGCLPDRPGPQVRAAIHHLLWTQVFLTDLDRPIGSSHVLRRAA